MSSSASELLSATPSVPREALRLHDPRGPPIGPVDFVKFRHPGNNTIFLSLPAYDPVYATKSQRGIHLRTALTACQIIAYNKPGYFTATRERTADRITGAADQIIPAAIYYYHLETKGSDPFYPICRDFRRWSFPHDAFPAEWAPNTPTLDLVHCNWSTQSQRVKDRDVKYLVSGGRDSPMLFPELKHNGFVEYLVDLHSNFELYLNGQPIDEDPQNLFALRNDLYLSQFDQAHFVIVPKSGQFVVHFVRYVYETANQYHNVIFDHRNVLLNKLLYARFAWALCKIVKDSNLSEEMFNFNEQEISMDSGKGKGTSLFKRTKRKHPGNTDSPADSSRTNRSNQDIPEGPLPTEECYGNVVFSDQDSRRSIDSEEHRKARRTLPDLFYGLRPPTQDEFENVIWYPGLKAVERRKQEYIYRHPQIQAYSGPFLPDNYSLDDEE